ncbi:hypothetical protein AAG570_001131 [Ranatra chinensis]|uniref:Armadillo repeat-containing protein 8 n=1 Tax=Ranatra chinensis TaxID=642074 RepID=A0ABD0YAZ5_9HEMI
MEKCLQAIVCLKNSVIGSNRQKGNVIAQGVVSRLMQLVEGSGAEYPVGLRVEAAVTLGSLAKGTHQHVKQLIEFGVTPLLLECIMRNEDSKLIETCLRCTCSIFSHSAAPFELIFREPQHTLSHLLGLVSYSVSNQICITTILSASCKTQENQNALCDHGAVYTLAALLCSPHYAVLMPTLNCLANLAYQNPTVSAVIATASYGGKSVPEHLVGLMSRDRPSEMQLASARCLTYLHRAGAISADDPKIIYKTLPCLVVLCKKDRPCEERIVAAESIAYLTEVNTDLQRLASISNQLIPTLANMLHCQPEANNNNIAHDPALVSNMKQAAFRAFASLGANDEDIRKRIIETERLMDEIVCGLEDTSKVVRLSAVRCLHSLSRSVQQLRTSFLDHSVWKPLMALLQGASDDILSVASSTLCNLILEFSPAKEPILESGGVDLLCSLTHRPDPSLRLNGIWALMNVAFQAEQKVKSQILNTLGTDQIFRLLSDPEVNAVTVILDSNHSAEVKEQALCILANIGNGDTAKEFIMTNDQVLKKLQDYMIAAIFCISNLVWKEESGSAERQAKLKEMGVYRLLQQLIMTSDTLLFDK